MIKGDVEKNNSSKITVYEIYTHDRLEHGRGFAPERPETELSMGQPNEKKKKKQISFNFFQLTSMVISVQKM